MHAFAASIDVPAGRCVPSTRERRLILASIVLAHLAAFWWLILAGVLEGHGGGLRARERAKMTVFGLAAQPAAAPRRLAGAIDGRTELRPELGGVPSAALVRGDPDAEDREEAAGDANALSQSIARALADDPLAGGERLDYRARLIEHIGRFLFYPPEALSRGLSGTVVVRFRIDRAGQVIDLRVVSTKGAVLDAAAMGTIWKAEPMPSVPPSIETPWEVDVPIDFSASARRSH